MTKKHIDVIKKVFTGAFIYWAATMLGNVLNWYFNLQLGRSLAKEDFAILTIFLSFQYIVSVPANALANTVSRFTAYYSGKGETEKHFYFFRQYWWLSWGIGIAAFVGYLLLRSTIHRFFDIEVGSLSLFFGLLLVPVFLLAFEKGVLGGKLAFSWAGSVLVVEALTKVIFLLYGLTLPFRPLTIAVLALPVSVMVAWIYSILVGRSFHPLPKSDGKDKVKLDNTFGYFSNAFFAGLGMILIFNIDVLLVKHFFSAKDAGIYATLSLLGKMLYFGAGSLNGVLVPLVARALGKGDKASKPFYLLVGLVTFVGVVMWLCYTLFPYYFVTLFLTSKGIVAIPYLSLYSLGMVAFVIAACISSYHLASKNYIPARLMLIAAIIEGILITLFHQSLMQVVQMVTFTLCGLLGLILFSHVFGVTTSTFSENVSSLIELIFDVELKPKRKKRVLIFNWRDIKHISAGGAEVYIHSLGQELIKKGYEVTVFTSNDEKNLRKENINGVQVIRRGGFVTVYVWAFLYYILKFRGKYDLIIDSENGIPFFSPLFSRLPVILLIHHVHQDIFFKVYKPPMSWIANFLESYAMPFIYRKSTIVAASDSTAHEAEELGMKVAAVIPSGVDLKRFNRYKKTKHPTISYVGRIKQHKGLDSLIKAFKIVVQKHPKSKLIIAGTGDYLSTLEKKVKTLGLSRAVQFSGYVSEVRKNHILASSWVMVQPSYMEGWGITCIEANACLTPVIASNVSGLKDAVSEGQSGYLFEYGNHTELSERINFLIRNSQRRKIISRSAFVWSQKFSWERQAQKFHNLILTTTKSPNKKIIFTKKIFDISRWPVISALF